MSRIRGSGNRSTELRLITEFRSLGFTGWRRGSKLPGRPDFVFRAALIAVFVDGCFWHGCPEHYSPPVGNAAFWARKVLVNRRRDRLVDGQLRRLGWIVVRIWEHELRARNLPRLGGRLKRLFISRNQPRRSQ